MAKISLSTRQSWTVLHCAFRLHFASKGNRFFLAMEPSWPSAAPSVSLTRFKVSCRRTRKADSFCLLLLLGFFLWCVCPQGGPLFQFMRMTPMYNIERRGVDPFHPRAPDGSVVGSAATAVSPPATAVRLCSRRDLPRL